MRKLYTILILCLSFLVISPEVYCQQNKQNKTTKEKKSKKEAAPEKVSKPKPEPKPSSSNKPTTPGRFKFGFTGGGNIAKIRYGGDYGNVFNTNAKSVFSFQVGGMVEYTLDDVFTLRSGLLVSGKGVDIKYNIPQGLNDVNYTINGRPIYIDIPILLRAYPGISDLKFYIEAGPYVGIGVAGTFHTVIESVIPNMNSNTNTTISWGDKKKTSTYLGTEAGDDLRRLDAGTVFSAGCVLPMGLQIAASYELGLYNIEPGGDPNYRMKNRVFSLCFGFWIQ